MPEVSSQISRGPGCRHSKDNVTMSVSGFNHGKLVFILSLITIIPPPGHDTGTIKEITPQKW